MLADWDGRERDAHYHQEAHVVPLLQLLGQESQRQQQNHQTKNNETNTVETIRHPVEMEPAAWDIKYCNNTTLLFPRITA